MDLLYVFTYFVIYSVLGWCCEFVYNGILDKKLSNSGFMYGPYCPVYGVGAICVLYPLMPLKKYPILIFVVGVIITSAIEYFTSWIMEKLFHTRWWDYSHYKFNIHGRVCLLNSTLFGIMCLVAVYIVHPRVEAIVHSIPVNKLMLMMNIAAIILCIDCIFTVIHLVKRKRLIEKVQQELVLLYNQFEKEMAEIKQGSQTVFMEWTQSRADLIAKTKAIHEKVLEILHGRLSMAFPKNVYVGLSKHLTDCVDEKLKK